MSEDRKLVVNSYVTIQGGAMGDTHNRNRTDISGSQIDTLNAGSQASGNESSTSGSKSPRQPTTTVGEVTSDSSTRRRIPLLQDGQQAIAGDHGETRREKKFSDSRAQLLVDRARYLLANSPLDHERVAKLLDDPDVISSDNIVGKALLAESYLLLGSEKRASKVTKELRKVIMASQMNGNDVMEYAKVLEKNRAFIRAVILLPIACEMFAANASSADDALEQMNECIWQLSHSVSKLYNIGKRPRTISNELGINSMWKMYKKLASVKNATPSVKVVKQAWALNSIRYCYGFAGKSDKSLETLRKGAALLEQQFQGDQSRYQVYGRLLNKIGAAHAKVGDLNEAKKYYRNAIENFEDATDFTDERDKHNTITNTQKNLNQTLAKIKKKK